MDEIANETAEDVNRERVINKYREEYEQAHGGSEVVIVAPRKKITVKKFEESVLERWKIQEIRKKKELKQLKKEISKEQKKEIDKTRVKFRGPKITQLPIEQRYNDVLEK